MGDTERNEEEMESLMSNEREGIYLIIVILHFP